MTQPVRRRTVPRSDGYGAAKPDVPDRAADDDEHPGGTQEFAAGDNRERRRRETTGSTSGGRGWSAYKKNASRSKKGFKENPDEFKVAELDVNYLIKVLEDAPMWSECIHYISEITEGKRTFCCGGDMCPPCDMGDIPTMYTVYDIALWVPDQGVEGAWVHKFWRATPDPAGKVAAVADQLASSRKQQHLSDEYLLVSKTEGKKRRDGKAINEFSVVLVKERDLEEDHDAYPLDDEDYEDLGKNPFDPEKLFPADSLKDLRAAAAALDD
jgi:hypothetical protein